MTLGIPPAITYTQKPDDKMLGFTKDTEMLNKKDDYPSLECPLCGAVRKPYRVNKDSVTYSCPPDHINHGSRYTWKIMEDGTLKD